MNSEDINKAKENSGNESKNHYIIKLKESRYNVLSEDDIDKIKPFLDAIGEGEKCKLINSKKVGEIYKNDDVDTNSDFYDFNNDVYYFQLINNEIIKTSYFIGIDWLVEDKLAVYVTPKDIYLNLESSNEDGKADVDYLAMLMEALEDQENVEHLDGLVKIDFDKPFIDIPLEDDILSIFLITQFLVILKKIVKKGLRKSYYIVEEDLKSKVKGKILVTKNIKHNVFKGNITDNICRYTEFGVNSDENKLLKKAFVFSKGAINKYKAINKDKEEYTSLSHLIKYINPAFKNVSEDISVNKIKQIKTNPVYKEYKEAIKLAKLILKRYSYDFSQVQRNIKTPPFWIDMSKLFELYVYKKLRECYKDLYDVKYHYKAYYQELDFVLKPKKFEYISTTKGRSKIPPLIVDAKYKPKYKSKDGTIKGIDKDDARQVSGYARLEKVYQELGLYDKDNNKYDDSLIECWIIYPDQDRENYFEIDKGDEYKLDYLEEIKGYVKFYKVGIKVPVK